MLLQLAIVVATIYFIWRKEQQTLGDYFAVRPISWRVIMLCAALWIGTKLLSAVAIACASRITAVDPARQVKLFFGEKPEVYPYTEQVVSAVVFAPVFEEFFFRGLFFRGMQRTGLPAPLAVLINGLFFGLCHSPQGTIVTISAGLSGATYAVLRRRTDSILPSMLMHLLNNYLSIILYSRGLPALF